ncbi:MAG: methylenetetrahydrofolate--tRNA-(uracil(54)-C(5))-methyltransferase (FADH(2)-oxidizing) TrmFO [bacterium]|nr:methylenetetrahydrofolate--tRNA-(uracil(54)-C(5))-methyltransferase (FADH(2)-oxidizing) TrmFO [bacterium]
MIQSLAPIAIVGSGLAGSEAALYLARHGQAVDLFEMRPFKQNEAHQSGLPAELVCSNSFKSQDPGNAHGALKAELVAAGSPLLELAKQAQVPAGQALAVDKEAFSLAVQRAIADEPLITQWPQEVMDITPLAAQYEQVLIATGPLTSGPLADSLAQMLGEASLYFYDAIAPVVFAESIDMTQAFRAARWGKGEADYINCPFNEAQYLAFIEALIEAEKVGFKDFEQAQHFEGCLPIEVLAQRGVQSLAFGALKPVGLNHPETGERYHAVLQLRQENLSASLYNLVGCQTRMTWRAQKEVFKMVPGLEQAEFARLGSMHRNSFLNAPKHLNAQLELKGHPKIQIAGQLTGAEGYTEALGTGLWAALCLHAKLQGLQPPLPHPKTVLGGLISYLNQSLSPNFQPMNANWGLVETPRRPRKVAKADFRRALGAEAVEHFKELLRAAQW